MDVVVTRLNEAPLLLRNVAGEGRHWLAVRLQGKGRNRDGIGARVRVKAGGVEQVNHVTGSVGYASASALTVHFGLGAAAVVDELEVAWPGGKRQVLRGVKADQLLGVEEN